MMLGVELEAERRGQEVPNSAEFSEPLDGLWLAAEVRSNAQPEWLGSGSLYVDALLAQIASEDDVEIGQRVDSGVTTIQTAMSSSWKS